MIFSIPQIRDLLSPQDAVAIPFLTSHSSNFAVTEHDIAGHMQYWALNCPFVGNVVWHGFDT